MPSIPLAFENVWLDKCKYDNAEKLYHIAAIKCKLGERVPPVKTSVQGKKGQMESTANIGKQVEKVASKPKDKRDENQSEGDKAPNDGYAGLTQRIEYLEIQNQKSESVIDALQKHISKLESRILSLEKGSSSSQSKDKAKGQPGKAPNKVTTNSSSPVKKEDDDDINLFGSDDQDDEENEKLKHERLKAYEAKKSKKPALIAKSNIILDVKPWDDETDMKEMERQVRAIQFDGLVWGASKLMPLAYGIHKLQISCVVEDEKVSVDLLQEKIEGLNELVQSMDIAAFNKV